MPLQSHLAEIQAFRRQNKNFRLSDNLNVQPGMAVPQRHRCRESGVKSRLIRATWEVKHDTLLKLSDNPIYCVSDKLLRS